MLRKLSQMAMRPLARATTLARPVTCARPVRFFKSTARVEAEARVQFDDDIIELPSDDKAKMIESTPDLVFEDMTLANVIASKPQKDLFLFTVNEDDTVFSAIGLMERQSIGAVLAKNKRGDFTGIFTERDYMRKIALKGLSSRDTPVKKVMTPNPKFLLTSDTATRCMKTMTEMRIRHLPVRHANTNEVVGMVSIGDILRQIISEYNETASHMRDLVAGKYPS